MNHAYSMDITLYIHHCRCWQTCLVFVRVASLPDSDITDQYQHQAPSTSTTTLDEQCLVGHLFCLSWNHGSRNHRRVNPSSEISTHLRRHRPDGPLPPARAHLFPDVHACLRSRASHDARGGFARPGERENRAEGHRLWEAGRGGVEGGKLGCRVHRVRRPLVDDMTRLLHVYRFFSVDWVRRRSLRVRRRILPRLIESTCSPCIFSAATTIPPSPSSSFFSP